MVTSENKVEMPFEDIVKNGTIILLREVFYEVREWKPSSIILQELHGKGVVWYTTEKEVRFFLEQINHGDVSIFKKEG